MCECTIRVHVLETLWKHSQRLFCCFWVWLDDTGSSVDDKLVMDGGQPGADG